MFCSEGKKVNVDIIGNEFVCFDCDGFANLLEYCRIVGSSLNEEKRSADGNFCPIYLLAEQVQVLVEAGMVTVRKVRNFDGLSDEPCSSTTSGNTNLEELRIRAVDIAKKRELKNRKRKLLGDNVPAKVLRIKKADMKEMNDVIVDELEIEKVFQELKHQKVTVPDDVIRVCYGCPLDCYEMISAEDIPFPDDIDYRARLTVFRDLWRKGFYLTSGQKFGCDYLAYEKSPGEEHSRFMVYCKRSEDSIYPLDVLSLSRVAGQVGKAVLLAVVTSNSVIPSYVEMNWWKVIFSSSHSIPLFSMLFFSFFKSLVGREVIVELKNDLSICGTLHSVDQYLNVKLIDITVQDQEKFPHMISVKNCFVRGSVVRYIHLPTDGIDTNLLQDATRKEILQSRQQAK
ncbi:unnamed protein product [Bursaphelenchus xylophilus]|nr:unnamed protein product [Bursaphelenchus xylophilus]CAG9130782.1 unnamed protein product [Bursaphelenchus xylophilus]